MTILKKIDNYITENVDVYFYDAKKKKYANKNGYIEDDEKNNFYFLFDIQLDPEDNVLSPNDLKKYLEKMKFELKEAQRTNISNLKKRYENCPECYDKESVRILLKDKTKTLALMKHYIDLINGATKKGASMVTGLYNAR